jgi:hypothetical protein
VDDFGMVMDVDNVGNVFAGGRFSERVDLNPDAGQNSIKAVGLNDGFMSIFDANGTYRSTKVFASMGEDWAYSITALGDGNVLATGAFSFSATMGDAKIPLESVGGYDVFLYKLNLSTDLKNTISDSNFSFYPNPTQGQTVINLNKEFSEMTVTVRNLLGAEISINNYHNVSKINLNLLGENGLYLVELKDGAGKMKTLKVVKR